jgi:hypothetical protein
MRPTPKRNSHSEDARESACLCCLWSLVSGAHVKRVGCVNDSPLRLRRGRCGAHRHEVFTQLVDRRHAPYEPGKTDMQARSNQTHGHARTRARAHLTSSNASISSVALALTKRFLQSHGKVLRIKRFVGLPECSAHFTRAPLALIGIPADECTKPTRCALQRLPAGCACAMGEGGPCRN